MKFPTELVIYIFSFTDLKYDYKYLNKNFNLIFEKKKIKSSNLIKKWYKSYPLHIDSNVQLKDIPRGLILRNILKETSNYNTFKAFITLPEFICLRKGHNTYLVDKMRQMNGLDFRRKTDVVKFLLNKQISNSDIFNGFNIILSLGNI